MKIIGYNTHLFGDSWAIKLAQFFGGATLAYKDQARKADIVAKLRVSGNDLVGLVEVWDDGIAASIVSALADVYPHHYRPNVSAEFLGSGLLLLSKWPLTTPVTRTSDSGFFPYNNLGGADKYSTKGILVQSFQPAGSTTDGYICFLTHTQAAYTSDSYWAERQANLIQLLQLMEEFQQANPDAACFAFGDFNVVGDTTGATPTEYEWMVNNYANAGFVDAFRTSHPQVSQAPGLTYSYTGDHNTLIPVFSESDANSRQQQRIDYLMMPGNRMKVDSISVCGADFRSSDGEDLSDHYPLTGTYSLC